MKTHFDSKDTRAFFFLFNAAGLSRFACCLVAVGLPLTLNAKTLSASKKENKEGEAKAKTLSPLSRPHFSLLPTPGGLIFYMTPPLDVELIADGVHRPEPPEPPFVTPVLKKSEFAVRSVPAIRAPAEERGVVGPKLSATSWTPLGPAPIPNGQTEPADPNGISLTQAPVSGRTTAVAINAADANIAFVGTAQGGLYRTTDGGTTWTPLLDNALNLAVGSIVIDPANTVLVGTGESNFSGDSFAGVGVYRITNANGANPVLTGPYNQDTGGMDVMTHRGIPGLAIDPNNHDIVYVGTATGQQGIGDPPPVNAPPRGLYRSTNFFSGAATFTKLVALGALEPANHDYRVTSIVYEPGNSDHLFFGVADATGNTDATYYGGIYYSANASAPTPTFTRVFMTSPGDATTDNFAPIKLAIRKIGNNVRLIAATAEAAPTDRGRAYKLDYNATQPHPTFAQTDFVEMPGAQGFGGGQASYNIGVDLDPNSFNNIYLVGTLASDGSTAAGTFIFSHDGGTTFGSSTNTLHVDSHMVGVAPSNSNVVYTGNDGGVWKTLNATAATPTFIDINTAGYSATQFQSIAVHPTDRNFSIGGTQDNGTEFLMPNGKWKRADFGDGGFALIDQTASNTENVTMYHTYYNVKATLLGFSRVKKASCATEGQWAFRGTAVGVLPGGLPIPIPILGSTVCDGSDGQTLNGINLADDTNFYAPMALGPAVSGSTGQTVYFGSDKLYRSTDQGDHMVVASQVLRPLTPPATANIPISCIGISPQNDNVRVCGTNDGHVFATTLGTPVLADIRDAGMPATYVARTVIDPNNANTVYAVFNGNAIPGKHVWKGNLSGFPTVTWSQIDGSGATGIPDISVNAFVVDPRNSQHLYAGTDRGVYNSTDGGAHWALYGNDLPNVQVFDLAIQNPFRILRAATHGRGFYEIQTVIPPVLPLSAVSRKVHGATPFDVNLPLTGSPGIECRTGGGGKNFQVVVTFVAPVTIAGASVTQGSGNVSSTSVSGAQVTINLSNVNNAQVIQITLTGVNDGTHSSSVNIPMAVLFGDTTANGSVNASDIGQTKAQSGTAVSASNFREDVTVNNSINSSDVSAVKSASGTALP
jgi:hypothetical protein